MRGTEGEHQGVTKATWLGHTLFLVEMPFVSSLGSGAKVLFDLYSAMVAHLPSFSDVPEANAVIILHNHYDQYTLSFLKTPPVVLS